MCRSIKVLRRPEDLVTGEEITAAALQFVRKVSGFRKPSKANQASFDAAVENVAQATQRLLRVLDENTPPRKQPAARPNESPSAHRQ